MRWAPLLFFFPLIGCQKPHAEYVESPFPCSTEVFRLRVSKVRGVEGRRLGNMTRDMTSFLVTAFVDPTVAEIRFSSIAHSNEGEWLEADCRAVYPEARRLLTSASGHDAYIKTFQTLRDGLKTGLYNRSSALRHAGEAMPATLAEFKTRFPYPTWSSRRVIRVSTAKGKRRVIYRSPATLPSVSVAETYEGGADSTLRETEILRERTDGSGHVDFYAYDGQGHLAESSLFLSSGGIERTGYVPHACLTCHYDETRRIFQRLPLTHRPSR